MNFERQHVKLVRYVHIDDAKRAGLLGNDNWSRCPKDMLRARAASKLARMVYPDAILGIYATEEASDFQVAPVASAKINASALDAEIMGGVAAVVDAEFEIERGAK